MPDSARRSAVRWTFGIAAIAVAGHVFAQGTPVYRYTDTDGKVVYSDRPPPANAKGVQTKRLGGNYIETSEPSVAAQQASEKFPVTLFTFPCGEVCQNAESLLNKRGVPFSIVNVQTDEQGRARLKALTNDDQAPVLAVGDQLIVKGYNETRWQATLDQAGYPKTQVSRRPTPTIRAPDAPPPPPPAADGTRSLAPPPKGGDYPKQ
ncbi:MAG: glutaredoxin family protein [Betaproteobacteria bacterium]